MTRTLAVAGASAMLLQACVVVTTPETTSGTRIATAPAVPAATTTRPHDALVPGTSYHATGTVPCSMGGGQPTEACPFGVQREGNGSGIVTVTKPDGRTRAVFFTNGRATGADVSQADPGAFWASKQADLNVIHIGEERYEIPDAVIFGG